jgi:hypothetical protein
MWISPNAELSRSRRELRSDGSEEQKTFGSRRKHKARRLSALVKSYASQVPPQSDPGCHRDDYMNYWHQQGWKHFPSHPRPPQNKTVSRVLHDGQKQSQARRNDFQCPKERHKRKYRNHQEVGIAAGTRG